jgi:hypothetical protein
MEFMWFRAFICRIIAKLKSSNKKDLNNKKSEYKFTNWNSLIFISHRENFDFANFFLIMQLSYVTFNNRSSID